MPKPKQPRPNNHEVANAIAKSLFVNGNGDVADRLVLTDDDPKRDFGGWCFSAAVDQIELILEQKLGGIAMPDLDMTKPSAALNLWVAEHVMGWTKNAFVGARYLMPVYFVDGQRRSRYIHSNDPGVTMPLDYFHPSSDIAHAHEMEDELERKGLHERYAKELWTIVTGASWIPASDARLFQFIHASPLQRVAAALTVIESSNRMAGQEVSA